MPIGGRIKGAALQKLRDAGIAGSRPGTPGSGRGRAQLNINKDKRTPTDRRAEPANNELKRADDIAALSYFQFQSLDTNQTYANAGETVPIVFCLREDDQGGVWVSPPLIDQNCSSNFDHEFAYMLTQGQTPGQLVTTRDAFVGSTGIAELTAAGIAFELIYGSGTTCPYGLASKLTCNHDVFSSALPSINASAGSSITHRLVEQYATKVTFRFKPLPVEDKPVYTLNTYEIVVSRLTLDGLAGPVVIVGQVDTPVRGEIVEIVDSSPQSGGVYLIEINQQYEDTQDEVEMILVQADQENTWPDSRDRTASYKDISLITARGNLYDPSRDNSDPKGLKQFHLFLKEGMVVNRFRFSGGSVVNIGAYSSNKFADLLAHYMSNSKVFGKINGLLSSDVATAAEFHDKYELLFNGIIPSGTNFLSWAQSIAPFFLMAFFPNNGVFNLAPLLPLDSSFDIDTGALSPKESFDDQEDGIDTIANSIIADSYRKVYLNSEERSPFQVLVSWRSQDEYGLETIQTTSVRYDDYADDVPEEAYDLSTFATNSKHAETYAKYLLATRRYSTHKIRFDTPRNAVSASGLRLYDLVKLSLNRVNSAGDNQLEEDFYLVTSMSFTQEGILTIEAEHFPVNGGGASVISTSIRNDSFTIST